MAGGVIALAERAQAVKETTPRFACHLAEMAVRAEPENRYAHEVRIVCINIVAVSKPRRWPRAYSGLPRMNLSSCWRRSNAGYRTAVALNAFGING